MTAAPRYVLGVWCGHDASAALCRDGKIIAAVAQERLDRIKHSNGSGRPQFEARDDEEAFPEPAVANCLEAAGISPDQVDVLTTNYGEEVSGLGRERVAFPPHHLCHAALAYHTCGAARCAVLVMDYAGDTIWLENGSFLGYERESAWLGVNGQLAPVWRHLGAAGPTLFGLGNIYNQVAAYLFAGHSDAEGKLMALAAYGRPNRELGDSFLLLRDGQVFVRPSALFREDPDRPSFLPPDIPHYSCELDWDALPPSPRDAGEFTTFHRDLAYRIQRDLEEAVVYLAANLRIVTGAADLSLAGGVALNCLANAKVLERSGFERVHVPFAPGDSGQAPGAALLVSGLLSSDGDPGGVFTGRRFSDVALEDAVNDAAGLLIIRRSDAIEREAACHVVESRIVGWFQGGSEFGPRALGARSILADPRNPAAVKRLNDTIKQRFWFQPVAPSILAERCEDWFRSGPSPFMTFAAPATPRAREVVPAVVHADGTSRVHTVSERANAPFHRLITEFERLTGVPLVANTSFNRKGEPLVETPSDALRCFVATPMDALMLGPFVVTKPGND